MLRRVLVTGAGSGIGLATTVHLAGLGFAVTGLVPTGEEEDVLLSEAARRAAPVDVVRADLSDPAQRAGLAEGMDLWGLVNNAGYMNAGQIRDVPVDEARRQLETMVLAPVDLARQALPSMVRKGQGRIVNVTSSAVAVAQTLTTGKPPPHVRIGSGAAWLRALDQTVPDRLWDRVVSRVVGLR